MLEVFTWSYMLTFTAEKCGWDAYQPITLPAFDIRNPIDCEAARKYVGRIDPDFVALAQCCTPWLVMQQMNQRTPHQCRELRIKQEEGRDLLCFTEKLVYYQADRHRAVISESPQRALSWNGPPML